MKQNWLSFTTRASVVAVRSALLTLALSSPAWSADDPGKDSAGSSKSPVTGTVEVGGGYVSQDSAKQGQYNGLQNEGGFLNGNVNLHGADPNTAWRWNFYGTDLGLETRRLYGDFGEQGRYRINLGYDELLVNRSDTFQTPLQGVGTNRLTLPGNWQVPSLPVLGAGVNTRGLSSSVASQQGLVNGVFTSPSAANLSRSATIIGNDLPAFREVDLSTKRKRYDAGMSYNFGPQWELTGSLRHENKDGLKPISTVNLANGGNIATVIPELIDQTTDQFNLNLNFKGEQAFLQLAYYGSMFTNNVQSMTWQDWSVAPGSATSFATMASAPSNRFNQFSLTGGYNYTPTTKLVVNASYARNTQDDALLTNNGNVGIGNLPLPGASLDGLVVTKAFNAKLTAKPVKDLNVAAGYKYDDRDNRTPVNTYRFYDAGEAQTGASPFGLVSPTGTNLGSNVNVYANRPYSKTLNQLNLDGDYQVARGHWLKGGYEFQKIDRNCPGSWIDCADANTTRENTLRAEWRTNVMEDVSGRIGYDYSQRRVSYNEDAWLALVPLAGQVPSVAIGGIVPTTSLNAFMKANGLTGFGFPLPFNGTLTGNRQYFFPNNAIALQSTYGSRNDISEYIGMRRFNMSDRNRDKLRSMLNWQANDQLSFQAGFNYNNDRFNDANFGLKKAQSWALNLDGTYAISSGISASLFYNYEDQSSKAGGDTYNAGAITNAAFQGNAANTLVSGPGCYGFVSDKNINSKVDSCLHWDVEMRDRIHTLGLTMRNQGLMTGRLDLTGDIVYSHATTDVNFLNGGFYYNNPLAVNAQADKIGSFFIPGANLPGATTNTIDLRLNGKYAIDKTASIRLGYTYRYMYTTDFAYDGMQVGGTPTSVLPTNEQSPRYHVNIFTVSYLYNFQ